MDYNETAKYFFVQLIKKYKLPRTIRKDELKKKAVLEGISISTFHNYYFIMDALELITFIRGSKEVIFDTKFYEGVFNAG